MLGYLLARAGVDVVVLETHADFFRDFRGDTIHPSTLQVMDELGLLDDLLQIPHSQARELSGFVGGTELKFADFSHVPGRSKFIALMPQWDFLNFLCERARAYPQFHLHMNARAIDLIRTGDRITGVRVEREGGIEDIQCDLVVAADGRHSRLRERAGLPVMTFGAPMDVLWMRVSRRPSDPAQAVGFIEPGRLFVMLNRNDYYQCAFVIRKGGFGEIQARGLAYLRSEMARLAPFIEDRTGEVASWEDVKLLTVALDRLARWYLPGFLCIGDAAHAMSPMGGVGINLAIQDAVAAANRLAVPLLAGTLGVWDLRAVQGRRLLPTRLTQGLQLFLQHQLIERILAGKRPLRPPPLLQLLSRMAWFRRIPAYVMGVGFRPEHVRLPAPPAR
ncbi:MAG: FAD-dependent oxidoreductase [Vulcanimicrobiaceae bacterium]